MIISRLAISSRGFAIAMATWHHMPDGRAYHESCIHIHESHFDAADFKALGPCPYPSRPIGASDAQGSLYYSDWSVYAQVTNMAGYSMMSSTWIVPEKPTSRGPVGQSAVYLFNGLEDGGGHPGESTLILQPVLQFGKSGCLLNPLLWGEWQLSAYLVDGNGRAHCGKRIQVKVGDLVNGTMTLSDDLTNTWTVSAGLMGFGETLSSYSASLGNTTLDAAYLTLEGMVIYKCAAYPPGGGIKFANNILVDRNGNRISSLHWVPEIRHNECAQAVVADPSSGEVTLQWDSTKPSADLFALV